MRPAVTFRADDLDEKFQGSGGNVHNGATRLIDWSISVSRGKGKKPVNCMVMPKLLFDKLSEDNPGVKDAAMVGPDGTCYVYNGCYLFITEDYPTSFIPDSRFECQIFREEK